MREKMETMKRNDEERFKKLEERFEKLLKGEGKQNEEYNQSI